jgi:16S rRNA (guanine527-N7)-methyltransferase
VSAAVGFLETLEVGSRTILGRALEGHEIEAFSRYLALLQRWQKVHRLVGSVEPGWVVENLFLDSLLFLRVMPVGITTVADIGSGAGFPGIPIQIVRPDLNVTLIESRQRRVSFLSAAVRDLGLAGAKVLGGRVESLPDAVARAFDAAMMRCAGHPGRLLPIAARLVAPGGSIILAGPPSHKNLDLGEWVEVPGLSPGRTRRFAVWRV